jgi:rhodanese-related sulfurtransferase
VLIDVRQPEEFNSGHVAGVRSLLLPTLAARLDELKCVRRRDRRGPAALRRRRTRRARRPAGAGHTSGEV